MEIRDAASNQELLQYILNQTAGLNAITYREYMGAYYIYCRDKLMGIVWEGQLWVFPSKSARRLLGDARFERMAMCTYRMLLMEHIEDGERLRELFEAMSKDYYNYRDLSDAGRRKRRLYILYILPVAVILCIAVVFTLSG